MTDAQRSYWIHTLLYSSAAGFLAGSLAAAFDPRSAWMAWPFLGIVHVLVMADKIRLGQKIQLRLLLCWALLVLLLGVNHIYLGDWRIAVVGWLGLAVVGGSYGLNWYRSGSRIFAPHDDFSMSDQNS